MKFYNKGIFIFLAFSCLSLNSMENASGSEQKNEEKTQVKQEKCLSLKAVAALNILAQIKSDKFTWDSLLELPEGLPRYIELFHRVDGYFDLKNETEPSWAELMMQTKALFYELISSSSEHSEVFVAAVSEFFHSFNNYNDEKIYKITLTSKIEDVFNIINSVLRIALNPSHLNEQNILLTKNLAQQAINWNLVYIIKLMTELNIFSRDHLILLFEKACCSHSSAHIVRLLNFRIGLQKDELRSLLKKEQDIFILSLDGHIDRANYILELASTLGLDSNEIINKKYSDQSKTLLMFAPITEYSVIVKFLLGCGINVFVKDQNGYDALCYAQKTLNEFDINFSYYPDEEINRNYISDRLKDLKQAIDLLTIALKNNDNKEYI